MTTLLVVKEHLPSCCIRGTESLQSNWYKLSERQFGSMNQKPWKRANPLWLSVCFKEFILENNHEIIRVTLRNITIGMSTRVKKMEPALKIYIQPPPPKKTLYPYTSLQKKKKKDLKVFRQKYSLLAQGGLILLFLFSFVGIPPIFYNKLILFLVLSIDFFFNL